MPEAVPLRGVAGIEQETTFNAGDVDLRQPEDKGQDGVERIR